MDILCQVFRVEVIHFIHFSLHFLLLVYTRFRDLLNSKENKGEFQIKSEIFFTLIVEYQCNDKTFIFFSSLNLGFNNRFMIVHNWSLLLYYSNWLTYSKNAMHAALFMKKTGIKFRDILFNVFKPSYSGQRWTDFTPRFRLQEV